MIEPTLLLFDDDVARRWEPFALTRPAGELLFGTLTLRARAERVFGLRCSGHLAAPHLVGFDEPGAPPVLSLEDSGTRGDRVYLLSRFVPDWPGDGLAPVLEPGPIAGPDGSIVGWFAANGDPGPPEDFLLNRTTDREPGGRLEGTILTRVWEVLTGNAERTALDIDALHPGGEPTIELPAGAFHWGDHPLIIEESAEIEPGVAFDTSEGPIWIDRHASVRAFSRVAGPAYIGRGSRVLGGTIEAVSLGPVCRVRGELAESVCLGYTNKQHDGHIGHAMLGRWVNLGAETTNSDLKNNYGTIRLWTPDGEVDTGEIKLGSLIGDHVKTGIGLLLNTGTVIGAGSNLYGSLMPPKYVPPFSWGTGDELVEFRLDRFLEVAERAMLRREVQMSDSLREQLSRAWQLGRAGTV